MDFFFFLNRIFNVSSRPIRTVIDRKTDSNRYESVLIMRKSIPIGSVTILRKNQANRTMHNPNQKPLKITKIPQKSKNDQNTHET